MRVSTLIILNITIPGKAEEEERLLWPVFLIIST